MTNTNTTLNTAAFQMNTAAVLANTAAFQMSTAAIQADTAIIQAHTAELQAATNVLQTHTAMTGLQINTVVLQAQTVETEANTAIMQAHTAALQAPSEDAMADPASDSTLSTATLTEDVLHTTPDSTEPAPHALIEHHPSSGSGSAILIEHISGLQASSLSSHELTLEVQEHVAETQVHSSAQAEQANVASTLPISTTALPIEPGIVPESSGSSAASQQNQTQLPTNVDGFMQQLTGNSSTFTDETM